MKKRQSKICKCKIAIPNYNEHGLFCNRCRKIIKIEVRKIWKIHPVTKIKKNKKKYNRKNKKNFDLTIKGGKGYDR